MNQLRRLVLTFRVKASSAIFFQWHTGMIYVVNEALSSTTQADWYDYFVLCISAYVQFCPTYRIARGIIRGLLSMAILQGAITRMEAGVLMGGIEDEADEDADTGQVSGKLVLDLSLATTAPAAARMDELAAKFASLS